MGRPPRILKLSDSRIAEIEQFLRRTKDAREYRRALAVLYNARDRMPSTKIAAAIGTTPRSVNRYIKRYLKKGLEGFKEGKRTGRKPKVTGEMRKMLVKAALRSEDVWVHEEQLELGDAFPLSGEGNGHKDKY